jgi:hypothetical protein
MPKAIPNANKADKKGQQPLPPALQPENEEVLEGEEQGGFEEYMAKELAEFEADEEDDLEEEMEEEEEEEEEDEEGDEGRHMAELQQLQQTDPEFFAFLQKNDPSLLRFRLEGEEEEDAERAPRRAAPAWLGSTSKKAVTRGCREFEALCRRLGGGEGREEDEKEEEDDERRQETIVRWGLGPGLRLAARCGTRVQRRLFSAVALLLAQAAGGWRALALEALGEPPAWSSGQWLRFCLFFFLLLF